MNECSCETPRPRHAGVHPTVCQYCNLIIEAESFEDKSPMMQNLTIAAIGALALIIGRKVTR
jgi:hypothetical protein